MLVCHLEFVQNVAQKYQPFITRNKQESCSYDYLNAKRPPSSGKRSSLSPREPGEFGNFSASRHVIIIGFSKCVKEITSLMSSMNFIFELAL